MVSRYGAERMVRIVRIALLSGVLVFAACRAVTPADASVELVQLPTGVHLDPAGSAIGLGSMPLAMALAPGGRRVAVLLNGWREQGVQIVDRPSGRVVQTLTQRAAFLGLAFSPDGHTLYASGGNQDVVYRYAWAGDTARLTDSLVLAIKARRANGTRYPAGLAPSPDGKRLYVAENLADSLAVVDLASGRVVQRVASGRYPYGVVVAGDGTVYVSAWGANTVTVFTPTAEGLKDVANIAVGRHPSALLLNAGGTRLFVASASTDRVLVIDTKQHRTIATLTDAPPAGPGEGSTPNALALSADETHLAVAEADNNAVAVFQVAEGTEGTEGTGRLVGRVPVEWYPTDVALMGDTLLVLSGKGRGTGPNPDGEVPGQPRRNRRAYTLGQTSGSLGSIVLPAFTERALAPFSSRVAASNGWDHRDSAASHYPPFEHVIYIIKENRTYDQVLGDLPIGDGDSSLTFFPRAISPNHHALAERFGDFDRFFVNSEVSADGHNWSMAAYATDYVQKTAPSNYSDRGRSYDYDGLNRDREVEDDAAEPAGGYLWNLAERAHITYRDFGEFVGPDGHGHYHALKAPLVGHVNPDFPTFDLDITDQVRAGVFLKEFDEWVKAGAMPQLVILRYPDDHTSGAEAGKPTPKAYMADNDQALGRTIDALSHSPFWKSTVVFVLEDDSQDGPDHVDSHRSPMLVISPYSAGGVIHRFTNTTDVIATITEILNLGSLSQFDYYGRPLRDVWRTTPDLTPYTFLTPAQSLDEKNPRGTRGARQSLKLDLASEDRSNDDLFNHILWEAIKGDSVPYPGTRRMSVLEARRGR